VLSKFELIVTVYNNKQITAIANDGAHESGEVKLEPLIRETIHIFEDWLSQARVKERREFAALGWHLYEVLFNGKMGDFFEKYLEMAQSADERLVVQLSFEDQVIDLANLPWEYLYYEPKGFFLSTHVYLVLSRFVQLGEGRKKLEPEKSPLRILIVVSNLEDQDIASKSADEVIKVIEELTKTYSIKFDILDKPTIDNFLDKLKETKPHVLHFIGHRQYDEVKKETRIAMLEADNKSVRWVRDDEFADYFIHMRPDLLPSLVLLHFCESKTNGSATKINYDNFTANFSQLAPKLLRVNVPAVVAMQHPIKNEAAMIFSKYFYQELAKGSSIDKAVQVGRWRISIPEAYDDRVFGTPVLYMRGYGSIIQPAEKPLVTQSEQASDEPAQAPKVDQMAAGASSNFSAKPRQDVLRQSSGSLSSEQKVIEQKQAKSNVDLNPVSASIHPLFWEGWKAMKMMTDQPKNQLTRMHQKLSHIRNQIEGKSEIDIIEILFIEMDNLEPDDKFGIVIKSMISASMHPLFWQGWEAIKGMTDQPKNQLTRMRQKLSHICIQIEGKSEIDIIEILLIEMDNLEPDDKFGIVIESLIDALSETPR